MKDGNRTLSTREVEAVFRLSKTLERASNVRLYELYQLAFSLYASHVYEYGGKSNDEDFLKTLEQAEGWFEESLRHVREIMAKEFDPRPPSQRGN